MFERYPRADVRVLAIWFRMMDEDAEDAWKASALPDKRIIHRWDEPKEAGQWFLHNLGALKPTLGGDPKFPQDVDAMWDTYMLFDKDARWTDAPTSIASWGYTVMRTKDQMLRDFEAVALKR